MSAERFDIVIFDVDGTLLDTSSGIIAAVQRVVDEVKLPVLSTEQLERFIGPPIQHSFAKIYNLPQVAADELAARFRFLYCQDKYLFQAVPYEGIYDTLSEIVTYTHVAIATYKRYDYATKILKHFGFDKFTTNFWGSDFEGRLTKRDIIMQVISKQGIPELSRVLMIGDTCHDELGADALGIKFLGVTYGFGFKSQEDIHSSNCIGIATNPLEILNYITK